MKLTKEWIKTVDHPEARCEMVISQIGFAVYSVDRFEYTERGCESISTVYFNHLPEADQYAHQRQE